MRILFVVLMATMLAACAKKDDSNEKQVQSERSRFYDVKPEQAPKPGAHGQAF